MAMKVLLFCVLATSAWAATASMHQQFKRGGAPAHHPAPTHAPAHPASHPAAPAHPASHPAPPAHVLTVEERRQKCLTSCEHILRNAHLCEQRCSHIGHPTPHLAVHHTLARNPEKMERKIAAKLGQAAPPTQHADQHAPPHHAEPAHPAETAKDSFCMHRCLGSIHNYQQCLERCNKKEAHIGEVLPTPVLPVNVGVHTTEVFKRIVNRPSADTAKRNHEIRTLLFHPVKSMQEVIARQFMRLRHVMNWREAHKEKFEAKKMETALERHQEQKEKEMARDMEQIAHKEADERREAAKAHALEGKLKQDEALVSKLQHQLDEDEKGGKGLSENERRRLQEEIKKEMEDELEIKHLKATTAEEQKRLDDVARERAVLRRKDREEKQRILDLLAKEKNEEKELKELRDEKLVSKLTQAQKFALDKIHQEEREAEQLNVERAKEAAQASSAARETAQLRHKLDEDERRTRDLASREAEERRAAEAERRKATDAERELHSLEEKERDEDRKYQAEHSKETAEERALRLVAAKEKLEANKLRLAELKVKDDERRLRELEARERASEHKH